MNGKTQTIRTYNQSALSLAKKFDGLGARLSDIEETLTLVKSNPNVLEIGCGNGRDAQEICKRTAHYLGIDISEKLIELAREKVPRGRFEIADIETYRFPHGLDVVFAFASLIHTPKDILKTVFTEIFDALNVGGVFRLSMKQGDDYREITKEDEFGIRTYYLYSTKDVEELGTGFSIIKNELNQLKGQTWLEMLLQKSG